MMIAIDAGHGYVKGLSARGGRVLFPSLIAPAPVTVDLGSYGGATVTRIDGQSYVVGEAARKWATPLWSRDKAVDDETMRLMLVAAAELGASGPIRLATGLPLAWFSPQRAAFQEALRGFGGHVTRVDGTAARLWFESVLVLPQGVAAAGPLLDRLVQVPGPYLVVDVGYRTTDYIMVTKEPDGRMTFDPTAAGSLELGIHHVDAAVAAQLSADHRTTFTPAQVATVETVIARGKRVSITADRARHEAHVARAIVQGLLERLDTQMDQVLGLVAVGGGSRVIAHALSGVITPENPQWANVQGYLAALEDTTPLRAGTLPGVV